jgi:4-hydroxy-4-methyl-2-oxoglutarate aldolase
MANSPRWCATIHEAMGRVGLMKPYMRPIYPGAQVCGTAVTVLLQPGDNWMMHVVAEQIQPGDVVVAACTADNATAFLATCWPRQLPGTRCRWA